ncbi:hypothetical protein D9756_003619 [Leucocoprinus leucothites]|uniref:Enoyl reductase (ER) domain-containing protein n=1 Tax=Leucocoprinus leucothites TaxID=201217 RepID=A0A8H5LJN4_9AGAR|nr:hypothetical protein D9756_003619 [Leucoagaricus leucothites]
MQTALMVNEKFGKITRTTRPIPQTADAGEIIVKIKAASINGMDWKIPKWGIIVYDYPTVLGYDVVGDVIAVGEGINKFSVGDKVLTVAVFSFGSCLPYPDFGGYQSYCKLKVDFPAKIPPTLTYDQASTFPIAFFAAYQAMYNTLPHGMGLTPLVPSGRDKYTNKPILIIGGGSYVGSFGIQFARLSGFSPVITTTSLKHADRPKGPGATHIIDRNTSPASLREQIVSILSSTTNQTLLAEGGLLEYVFDAISAPSTQSIAFDLVAAGERVNVGATTGFPDVPKNRECVKAVYDQFTKWIEDGLFVPSNVEVVPGGLDAVVDCLKRMENNEISTETKPVIHPSESS